MNHTLLINSAGLFAGLLIIGAAACLPLYKWSVKRLTTSSLWTKIVFWIPIYSVLISILYLGPIAAGALCVAIALSAVFELKHRHATSSRVATVYALGVTVLFASLPFYWTTDTTDATLAATLLCVCFASALSDVCAFFGGKYLGKHKLPPILNSNKAWEGVAGQIIGGVVGFNLTATVLDIPTSLLFGTVIGIASAIGDLVNSFVKRRLGIVDWGNTIPGHGGSLDRFSSLSFALACGLIYALVSGAL